VYQHVSQLGPWAIHRSKWVNILMKLPRNLVF
jgi:hypothetical protein